MQIRRLRYQSGTHIISGQIINVPVDVQEIVSSLPRCLDDDYAFNVSLKKNLIHKSSAYSGLVRMGDVKAWLQYLEGPPLYQKFRIQVDWTRVSEIPTAPLPLQEILETIAAENDVELLQGTQQTGFLWSEDKYLCIAPGQQSRPTSIIDDEYAEELSLPDIYYGVPRKFRNEVKVTPFMIVNSEIRRRDRRGTTPEHILYMAVKILRLRVTHGLYTMF